MLFSIFECQRAALQTFFLLHRPSAKATEATRRTNGPSVAPALAVSALHGRSGHTFIGILSSKKVQAVNNVEHGIAIDAVIRDVITPECSDRTAEITLPTKNIIELQADRQ